MESGDILVQVFPAPGEGVEVELTSAVATRFGRQIKQVISDVVASKGLSGVRIEAVDKGALDCTIRARTEAALARALNQA